MRLSVSLGLLQDLFAAFRIAFIPTFLAILRSPSLLLRPHDVSEIFMSHVWVPFGAGIDENSRPVKQSLIPENAHGVVLELGAGHGHTVQYLARSKVTKYIALEPNALMHPAIREISAAHGFTEADGSLLILPFGAENTTRVLSAIGSLHAVDTIISILTLCSIPDAERSLRGLVSEALKPGGTLLFYEHVLSPRADVAWWQQLWTPVWKLAFGGCCLDRPTHVWVKRMDAWAEGEVWGLEGEPEEHLFWHRIGKFVKKS